MDDTVPFDLDAVLQGAFAAHRAGGGERAGALYRRILAEAPEHGEAWQGIGLIRLQADELDTAQRLIERALCTGQGDRHRMWYHLGLIAERLGRNEAAIEAFSASTREKPGYEGSYRVLALLLQRLGRGAEAASVYVSLGRSRFRRGLSEEALEAFRTALTFDPDCAAAHLALAPLLRFYGRPDEAVASYHAVLAREPGNLGARLGLCAAQLRIIHETPGDLRASRAAYARELATLHRMAGEAGADALAGAEFAVGDCKPFYLNYHGVNDGDLQRLYGETAGRIMGAHLPHCAAPPAVRPNPAGRRLRVGFISTFLYEHSVSKLFSGWATELDRSRFELFVYHLGGGFDGYTDRFRDRAVRFAHGLPDTRAWAEAIRGDGLDALIYLDVGMSGMEVRLAPLRLAPVQCVAWGHPVTTGFPAMDYFLSSVLMEPFNGQDHYTETLVPLPNLSIHYEPILYDDEPMAREDLGLAPKDVAFTCCQSLFKYLPQYDRVFPAIARHLPAARFLFIRHHLPEVSAVFERRMEAAFRTQGLSAADHVRIVDRMPRDQFGSFLACGDVYLDSIGWSGGNTTLEAMAHHRPTVTLAADLMRGRHSTGILRRLGLDAFITHSLEEYAARAVALGADAALRRRVSEHIAGRKGLLYRDTAPVRALEGFLASAVAARA